MTEAKPKLFVILYEPCFWRFAKWERRIEVREGDVLTQSVLESGWWFAPRAWAYQKINEAMAY